MQLSLLKINPVGHLVKSFIHLQHAESKVSYKGQTIGLSKCD